MNTELFYKEKGKGFPLILLHGNGENCDYFKNQMEFFSDKYRVIAVDTRGHGKSPRGTAPFSIQQFADDLYKFMNRLDISKAIILGFSDGANIAMKFALKYQNKIEKLILNGGNLNTKCIKAFIQIPIEIGYRMTKVFSAKCDKARKSKEMLGLMVNDPNIDVIDLSAIKVPTLVIAGTRDMIKENHTKLIANSIPNAELKIINGTHFIANTESEIFNKIVNDFLNEDF